MDCTLPLPESELETAARSAWKYETEGRNLVGRGKAVVISHNTIDRVMAYSADAFYLLMRLKRYNWGRDFVMTKPMAEVMGWGLPRWKMAREVMQPVRR